MSLEDKDILIAKVLSGEAGPEEIRALEEWEALSEINRAYAENSRKIFAAIDQEFETGQLNVDAAWKKVQQRINEPEKKVRSLFGNNAVLKIAAGLALILTLSVVMVKWLEGREEEQVLVAGTTEVLRKSLPDGSRVLINKNSALTYKREKNLRKVELKGEAFFEVVHDEQVPFIVSVGPVLVKDIGTAFNVKEVPSDGIVEVQVTEGEVQFYASDNAGIRLVAGEKAVYHERRREFIRFDPGAQAATARSFRFEEASLSEVVEDINKVYKSKVRLSSKKLANCKLSVQFNNEDLDLMLSVIAETLDLEVISRGDSIILKGEGCQ